MASRRDQQAGSATIGLVLAGGGARGAYEAGVLSVLLPALEARGERVSVIVGTSVGAVNGSWLAANLHKSLSGLTGEHGTLWTSLTSDQVIAPIMSIRFASVAARYLAGAFGARVPVGSLLDARPLEPTLRRLIDVAQLHRNVATGHVHAAAVVATSASSGRSVVFHHGGGSVAADDFRGIDYAPVALGIEHVRASASIPGAFAATRVTAPDSHAGWYFDGGTRLNTPLKPALALGASRLIVIGLNSTLPAHREQHDRRRPDIFQGAGQLTQAILADPLAHDVRTLARLNTIAAGQPGGHYRVVPYVLVEPRSRNRIGELAQRVFTEHYARLRQLPSSSVAAFGRLVHAQQGAANGELLSYLFFAPEFAEVLMAEGAADAQAWLEATHEDGIWQHGPYERQAAPERPTDREVDHEHRHAA